MRGLVIFALIAYTVFKVFRYLFKGSVSAERTSFNRRNHDASDRSTDFDGNVVKPPKRQRKDFKGGEYVDYEEVD